MKRLIQILASLVLVAIISSSCIFMEPLLKGNGNVVEETRKAGEFNKIKVSRGMNVYISQGDKTKIVVKADDNLLDAIETRMNGRKYIKNNGHAEHSQGNFQKSICNHSQHCED